MSRADIQAGRAFIELALKDAAFRKGLSGALQQVKGFGGGISAIHGAIAGLGSAGIIGALLGTVKKFAAGGEDLDKMAKRTGVSGTALSELGFAAEQSGQGLDTLETSLKRMQKTVGGAFKGSKESWEALHRIGVSVSELRGLQPDQQFEVIAEALSKIKDPTMRAAGAMQIFGRSGTDLLPMMEDGAAGIAKLRKEAKDLGLSKSQEDISLAAKMAEAFKALGRVSGSIFSKIGSAITPVVLEYTKVLTGMLATTGKWIKDNKGLVQTIALVATGGALAAAAFTVLGLSAALAGYAFGALASIMGAIGGAITLIASPLGILVAALLAGVLYWALWTKSGKSAVAGIMDAVGPLLAIFKQTFTGIKNAIAGGDLGLAGNIAMAGLKLSLLQGLSTLTELVGGEWGDFVGKLGTQIADGDLSAAWSTSLAGMAAGWAAFAEGLVAVFTEAIRAIVPMWLNMTKSFSDWMLKNASKGGLFGDLLINQTKQSGKNRGRVIANVAGDAAKSKALKQQQSAAISGKLAAADVDLEKAIAGGGFLDVDGVKVSVEEIRAQIADLEGSLAALGVPVDTLALAQKNAGASLKDTAAGVLATMDQVDKVYQAQTKAAVGNLKNKTGGGANDAVQAVRKAQLELNALNKTAAEKAKAVAKEDEETKDKGAHGEAGEMGNLSKDIVGSFSAASLTASGVGFQTPINDLVAEAKEARKVRNEMLKAIKEKKEEERLR
jgi:hypothetical protein